MSKRVWMYSPLEGKTLGNPDGTGKLLNSVLKIIKMKTKQNFRAYDSIRLKEETNICVLVKLIFCGELLSVVIVLLANILLGIREKFSKLHVRSITPVSYTHLDVYKRQYVCSTSPHKPLDRFQPNLAQIFYATGEPT